MNFGGPPQGPPPGMGPGGYGAPPPGPPGANYGYGAPPPGVPDAQMRSPPPPGVNPGHSYGVGSTVQDTTGSFEGVSYRIDHRDSNSILQLTIQPGYTVKAKPGSMVTMAGTVQIKGAMKFSLSKMISGGEMSESQFTGPGDVILAPEIWGDIIPITVTPNVAWSVGKDAFLACTPGITRSSKSQGFMKGLMSGEGFFVAKVQGQGVLFVQSVGAIIKRDLAPGEEWIVDNGHLVAWSATYTMERIKTTGGGMFSASHTGEGAVCRFKGPGTIYIQTRNPESLTSWIAAQMPSQGRSDGGGGGSLLTALAGS